MAFNLRIPFHTFRLRFDGKLELLTPASDPEVLRLKTGVEQLTARYQRAIQEKVINQGDLQHFLEIYQDAPFEHITVTVGFPGSPDGLQYPAFALEFDAYLQERKAGYWGVVPGLGIEAFGAKKEQLAPRLAESIRLDFIRRGRLASIQDLIASVWLDSVELLSTQLELRLPLPGEDLNQEDSRKKYPLLRSSATPLQITDRVVYGRSKELERMSRALKSRFGKSVLLVGPSGVGKTALIWEISRQAEARKIKGTIWETTASMLIKELTRDLGWEYYLGELCQELKASRDFLFVRNLMELFEVGQYIGNDVSLAEYLLPFLARGEINLLSECTEEELAIIEVRSPSYLSHFQVIHLAEPQADLEAIITRKIQDVASRRKVRIVPEAILELIRLNRRFTPYEGMPGKPIRFLESMILNQVRGDEANPLRIDRTEIIRYFCTETGMPIFMVDPSIPMVPEKIKRRFNAELFGQEAAVDSVVDILAAIKTALTRTGKPIVSFLFVGPTGVGKTELAKILAEFMFGSRERMLRFDMSEYNDPFSVMRLTGQGPGEEGVLTSAVRREPFSVLLFDEIEKAHASFFDLLLQILSEGRLTDNSGRLANFCSSIIIMTSNIGASSARQSPIGWKRTSRSDQAPDHFERAVQQYFRPELYNRIDRIVPFASLGQETIRHVVDREIRRLLQREGINFRPVEITFSEQLMDFLARRGYHEQYGARHLQRTLREELIIPLARVLNRHETDTKLLLSIDLLDERPVIEETEVNQSIDVFLARLDSLNATNFAGSLRREVHRLGEGYAFTLILQHLDRMDQEIKREGEAFWKDRAKANQYTQYVELKTRLERLQEEISDLEVQLSLIILRQEQESQDLTNQIDRFEERLMDFKLSMYSLQHPAHNTCFFHLYGRHTEAAATYYWELFRQAGFTMDIRAVWFVPPGRRDRDEEGRPIGDLYHRTTVDAGQFLLKQRPREEEATLAGYEFMLTGKAVFLYLAGEAGVQEWRKPQDGKMYPLEVSVLDRYRYTTFDIRQDREYFKRISSRRVVDFPNFRDTNWKVQRELAGPQYVNFLKDQLDFRFTGSLNDSVQ